MRLVLRHVFAFISVVLAVFAHDNSPPFQRQEAQKPPEVHHQNIHQQHAPSQPNTPPSGAQQFGGQEAHNAEHIKEHLEGKVDPTVNMTQEQLQFHYFKIHDRDNDGCLDGTELIKAITHFHLENPDPLHKHDNQPPPLPSEVQLEEMIDQILGHDDYDGNGCISYPEFSKAQKDREMQARQHQSSPSQPR